MRRKKQWILGLLLALSATTAFGACGKQEKAESVENEVVTDGKEQDATSGEENEKVSEGTEDSKPEGEAPEGEKPTLEDLKIEAEVLPKLSVASGAYAEDFALELSCAEAEAIYYTTDGSDPRTSETRIKYEGALSVTDRAGEPNVISAVSPSLFDAANAVMNAERNGFDSRIPVPEAEAVDKCTTIRVAACLGEKEYSAVATGTYFVGDMAEHIQGIKESCEAAGTTLAIISITMEQSDLFDPTTGIYVKGDIYAKELEKVLASGKRLKTDEARNYAANYTQRGREWERSAHIDFLESDGTTTTCVLQQDCGIRVQGNYSRSDLQKGFRLYARKDYGEKNFKYAVFGEELTDDAGKTKDKFKTLILRNGGNCAFTTKYSDTYWQSLLGASACDTQASRPCVVYLNGEYWGLYVLEEDYSEDYFEDTHGVVKENVVLYKGDAEKYASGYKLDLGELPEGVSDESYYFKELYEFFESHKDLSAQEDYEAFIKLVDPESVLDYYAAEIWINNKWDWPGKNWSMWKTTEVDAANPYADGRWRFCFYDMEFGGVSGASDARTNTIKEDNYQPDGMLDDSTNNVAVLCYVYLMSNEDFRSRYIEKLTGLSEGWFEYDTAKERLDWFNAVYSPLYPQFFERYPGSGDAENSVYGGYASYQCIADFLEKRAGYIQPMVEFIEKHYQ
ncbi:MAG: CotH kinase family protein [Lachnospiraceae bacterium]|nr:CotH kinase family protein [Lachnospiraceae bacterium]